MLIHHGIRDICDKSIKPLICIFASLWVSNCDLSCWSSSKCWKRLWHKISALDLVQILNRWRKIASHWISHHRKNMFNLILSLTLFLVLVFISGLGPLNNNSDRWKYSKSQTWLWSQIRAVDMSWISRDLQKIGQAYTWIYGVSWAQK